MRKFITLLSFAVVTAMLTATEAFGCSKVILRQGMDFSKVLAKENTKYVVKNSIDLGGRTIQIGTGSALMFKGGSLTNGTLRGTFKLKNVKEGSLYVNFSNCSIAGTVPVYNNGDVAGLLSSCVDECKVMEDITIDKSIKLRACIKGNGYTITCSEKTPVAIYINDSKTPITIDGLVIKKLIPPGTINQNYAINSTNSSNITIKNSTIEGRIRFANKTKSDSPDDISENISILNSKLLTDFSTCPQGWEYGQDHLAFYSIKNVRIEDCTIESKNVNRVLKTSAYFETKDYPAASNCTDGVVFKNNKVTAEAQIGKQFWDMFCGTVNVLMEKNVISLKGFTRFVEDKAFQPKYKGDKLLSSTITLRENNVYMEGGDLFQFLANAEVDNFVVTGNSFTLAGVNKHPITGDERTCGFYLQGYKSCRIENNSFVWRDEAVGLMLGKVNFVSSSTIIKGNTIQDAYRIYFAIANHPKTGLTKASCDDFVYTGNTKRYTSAYHGESRSEIFVAQSSVRILQLDFGKNDAGSSFLLEFGKESKVDSLSVSSDSEQENLFRINNTMGTSVTNVRVPVRYRKQGSEWRVIK